MQFASVSVQALPIGESNPPPGASRSGLQTPAIDLANLKPVGPFLNVSKGSREGISWRLDKARGNQGTTCWRMVTKPKAKPATGINTPGNIRCLPPTTADADLVDVPLVVGANASGSKVGYVAIVVPKGTRSVKVGQIGGQFTTISKGKSLSGPIVFVGKKSPLWVDMTLPGKHRLACQGGVVMDKYDLKDSILTDNSVGAAWFCDEL